MKNKVSEGKTAKYTAAVNVESGAIVAYLGKIGIATQPISSGSVGILDMEGGVYEFNCSAALGAKTAGTPLYVPTSPSNGSNIAATSASGAIKIGVLEEAIGTGVTKIHVRLD